MSFPPRGPRLRVPSMATRGPRCAQRAAPTAAGHALNTRSVLLPFLCSSLSQPWTPSLLLTPLHTPLASRPALQQQCRARKRTPSHTLRLRVRKPSSPTPPPREGTRAWSQILKSRRLVAEEREMGSALLAPPKPPQGGGGGGDRTPPPRHMGVPKAEGIPIHALNVHVGPWVPKPVRVPHSTW